MYKVFGTNTKKMLNMLILEILEVYSDVDHPLTQKAIQDLLEIEYGTGKIDRRSVRANVTSLKEMGYDIEMDDERGYYLISRDFDEAELRLLIDSVLFSKGIPVKQAKSLIEKLEDLSNKYFKAKVSHVATTPDLSHTDNKQVMYVVNDINDAIDQKKKISFKYNRYGLDMKLHSKDKEFIMNPYQMIAANGHYYVIGNIDKYDNITHYRIDKISNIKILDEKIKPMKEVEGLENGLQLPKHVAEHIYMFHGESVPFTIKCSEEMMDALVDWFGKDIKIMDKRDPENLIIMVKCNYRAMFFWALQYGPFIEILEPDRMRKELKEAIEGMAKKYN